MKNISTKANSLNFVLPSAGFTALRDNMNGEILQKDGSREDSGIKTQQSSQQPLLSLSQVQIDSQANRAIEDGRHELKDGAQGLAGHSLTNMCELTFSTHCSSIVPSKTTEAQEAEYMPGKLEMEEYCDQNRKQAKPAQESFSQILKFNESITHEQNGTHTGRNDIVVLEERAAANRGQSTKTMKHPRIGRSKRHAGRLARDEEKENARCLQSQDEKEKEQRFLQPTATGASSGNRNEHKSKQVLKCRSQDSRKALKDITGPAQSA